MQILVCKSITAYSSDFQIPGSKAFHSCTRNTPNAVKHADYQRIRLPSLEGARWICVVAGVGSPPCSAGKVYGLVLRDAHGFFPTCLLV